MHLALETLMLALVLDPPHPELNAWQPLFSQSRSSV